jgi:hypothetical protein
VQLQNGTATLSQGGLDGFGPNSPDQAVDGLFDHMGWSINHFYNNDPRQEFAINETAVCETAADLGPAELTFTMHFLHGNVSHLPLPTLAVDLEEGATRPNWPAVLSPAKSALSAVLLLLHLAEAGRWRRFGRRHANPFTSSRAR